MTRAGKDMLMVLAATAATVVVAISIDLIERLWTLSRSVEHVEIDEILAGLVALLVGLAWYSVRRTGDLRRHVDRRIEAEGELKRTLAMLEDLVEQRTAAVAEVNASLRAEARERQRALDELDHRVKNNLASVLSLARQTMNASSTMEQFGQTFMGRIDALARTHEALASTRWEGVDLRDVLQLVSGPFADGGRRIRMCGEPVRLPARASRPLTMTFHELSTNALRCGALSAPAGYVTISWSREADGRLRLGWRERGGPPVRPPERTGLGISLMKGFIEFELGGSIDLRFPPQGLEATLLVPLGAAEVPVIETVTPAVPVSVEAGA